MAVTLQQIAQMAGVSRGTVDRALNNRGRIKPEVEKNIKRIAKELGYRPSRAGRALAMAKKKLKIGVIVQSAKTLFIKEVLSGLRIAEKEIESLGASLEIHTIDNINASEVIAVMEIMRQNEINAIAMTPAEDPLLMQTINKFVREYSIPIVTFNMDLEDTDRLCFVGQDTKRSGQTAAGLMGEMINEEGDVIIISDRQENPSLKNRAQGFMQEIEKSYPHINILGIRYAYDDNWVAGKIIEETVQEKPNLKGVYITGPGVIGVCSALKKAGKASQIKVIANDIIESNVKLLLDGTINFLIGQNAHAQGYDSVMILFRKLLDGKEPRGKFQYTDIVIKNRYNV